MRLSQTVTPLISVLALLAVGSNTGNQQEIRDQKRGKLYTVVSSRAAHDGVPRIAVAVDQDDAVVLLLVDSGGKISSATVLGQKVHPPPTFACAGRIPAEQVLLQLRSISDIRENWRVWVAVSVGATPSQGDMDAFGPTLTFFYIFKQSSGSCVETLAKETYASLEQLIIEDINDDGRDYIFAKYNSGGMGYNPWADLWAVTRSGNIEDVSLKALEAGLTFKGKVDITIYDYQNHHAGLMTEEEIRGASGPTKIRKTYEWDQSLGQYKMTAKSKSVESPVP
ncbi:MAG: hypothetical protein WCE53_12095 [Candidatus Acidiferrum sp.]